MSLISPLSQIFDQIDFERNKFKFEVGSDNPTKLLRNATNSVPNLPGLYFVFCKKNYNEIGKSHLYFFLENLELELLYFGKAGGTTNKGKTLKQNLIGRINNVVSGDIPRAIYWNSEMIKNNELQYIVYYSLFQNPSSVEKEIYNYLDLNSLEYPRMNKKLGRKKNNENNCINFLW